MFVYLQGAGLVIFITGGVMNRVLWKDSYRGGRNKLFVETIGYASGSKHVVRSCALSRLVSTECNYFYNFADACEKCCDPNCPIELRRGIFQGQNQRRGRVSIAWFFGSQLQLLQFRESD